MPTSPLTQIVSLIGYQGSGKTTIGYEVAKRLSTEYVETSAVVKEANKHLGDLELATSAARNLSEPNWLVKLLEDQIDAVINKVEDRTIVVLGGVREPHIYERFQDRGYALYSVWLYASPFVRFNRLTKQGRVKTVEQFITREFAERALGIKDLEKATVYQAETSDMIYPHQTAAAITHFLKEKGLET